MVRNVSLNFLIDIAKETSQLKKNVGAKKFSTFNKNYFSKYKYIFAYSDQAFFLKQMVGDVLSSIVDGKKAINIRGFDIFVLREGNIFLRSEYRFNDAGEIELANEKDERKKFLINALKKKNPPFLIPEFYYITFTRKKNKSKSRLVDREINISGEIFKVFIEYQLYHSMLEFMSKYRGLVLIQKCEYCDRFFIASKITGQRFCPGDRCRIKYHNKEYIASGKAKEYKRQKRKAGARPSYYG